MRHPLSNEAETQCTTDTDLQHMSCWRVFDDERQQIYLRVDNVQESLFLVWQNGQCPYPHVGWTACQKQSSEIGVVWYSHTSCLGRRVLA